MLLRFERRSDVIRVATADDADPIVHFLLRGLLALRSTI
jgi:hypothetical protein